MTETCAHCDHPAEDHATGICLHTLECLCPGYRTVLEEYGPVLSVEEWRGEDPDDQEPEEEA